VVKDTGKGISPEFLPHIFKRFSHDEAGSRENGGLGVGLAICKHLVELHGGSIRAESAGPGRGAVIKVKFRTIRPVRRLPNGASDRWSFIWSTTLLLCGVHVSIRFETDEQVIPKSITEEGSGWKPPSRGLNPCGEYLAPQKK
jgi:Histidine kinase-, DNA gyrase B-, and HSP90-like ATPase